MDTDTSAGQRFVVVSAPDRRLLVPIVQVRILAAEQLLRGGAQITTPGLTSTVDSANGATLRKRKGQISAPSPSPPTRGYHVGRWGTVDIIGWRFPRRLPPPAHVIGLRLMRRDGATVSGCEKHAGNSP